MTKKFIAIILVLIAIATTIITFAYWSEPLKELDDTLLIGTGLSLEVNVTSEDFTDNQLVPKGVLLNSGDLTELVYTYSIQLDQESIDNVELGISITNLLINQSSANISLVNTSIEWKIGDSNWVLYNPLSKPFLYNNSVLNIIDVRIVVTLNEPVENIVYESIKNSEITFSIIFLASNA